MNNDNRRIAARFAALAEQDRAGLVTFITAGDPDFDTSLEILNGLPDAGADLIELGMPFSDPMADGPAIQDAGLRALSAGATMETTFELVRRFRENDSTTPIVLMGYYNPVYHYGTQDFCVDAAEAGVDGLIIVDLPPEEDAELRNPADKAGLDVIRLATPTTDDARLPRVLDGAGGFLYYVAVAGVTGTKSAASAEIASAVARLRKQTDLPLGVGFGIKTPEQAAEIAAHADAAVVGSAIVSRIADGCAAGKRGADIAKDVLDFVARLSQGVRKARKAA